MTSRSGFFLVGSCSAKRRGSLEIDSRSDDLWADGVFVCRCRKAKGCENPFVERHDGKDESTEMGEAVKEAYERRSTNDQMTSITTTRLRGCCTNRRNSRAQSEKIFGRSKARKKVEVEVVGTQGDGGRGTVYV